MEKNKQSEENREEYNKKYNAWKQKVLFCVVGVIGIGITLMSLIVKIS